MLAPFEEYRPAVGHWLAIRQATWTRSSNCKTKSNGGEASTTNLENVHSHDSDNPMVRDGTLNSWGNDASTFRPKDGVGHLQTEPTMAVRSDGNHLPPMELRRHYQSAFAVWAALLVPAGMYGLNCALSLVPFLNVWSACYGLLIAIWLGWLCKSVSIHDDHLVISRFAGLWQKTVPYSDICYAGSVDEGRSYSLTIQWHGGLIRIWPLTCFGMDDLIDSIPVAIECYRDRADR